MSRSFDDPRIAAGMRQHGWKVGMGAPALKQKLGLTAPIVGFLLDRALLPSGAEVSLQGWQKPVAEAEIAAYLGRNLPSGADRATARAAITALGPAIELADVDCRMDDIERVLAGDIFQRHVLLGPSDPTRASARLDGLVGRVTHSGRDVPVPADLEANIGEIVAIVQHVADVAGALGDGLRAGQFIICGSLTPPMFLEPGDSGVHFSLDPAGSVSVGLSWPAA